MDKNLAKRLLVAAVAIPAILWLFYSGERSLIGAFVALLTVLAAFEFSRTVSDADFFSRAIFVICAFGVASASMLYNPTFGAITAVGAFMIINIILAVGKGEPVVLYKTATQLSWGLMYVALLYPFIFHVRFDFGSRGFAWIMFLLGAMWIGDTVAMWVGKSFGSRKLAPLVSPNKTMEGFVGGLAGAVILGIVFGLFDITARPTLDMALIGLALSLVGQLGDLVKSVWKRAIGVKDSSGIIPGHGGVIDRFDSLAFAAPTLWAILRYF